MKRPESLWDRAYNACDGSLQCIRTLFQSLPALLAPEIFITLKYGLTPLWGLLEDWHRLGLLGLLGWLI